MLLLSLFFLLVDFLLWLIFLSLWSPPHQLALRKLDSRHNGFSSVKDFGRWPRVFNCLRRRTEEAGKLFATLFCCKKRVVCERKSERWLFLEEDDEDDEEESDSQLASQLKFAGITWKNSLLLILATFINHFSILWVELLPILLMVIGNRRRDRLDKCVN